MTLARLLWQYHPLSGEAPWTDQTQATWLGPAELRELAGLRHPDRRRQWLAGRWFAKHLAQRDRLITHLPSMQILTRDERGRGMRPRVLVGGRQMGCSVSISHSDQGVLAALARDSWVAVGVDLAIASSCHNGFYHLWFTPGERRWISGDPGKRTATVWAIKEAVYKAAHRGQPWAPRDVEVWPRPMGGFDCAFRGEKLQLLSIGVHEVGEQVAVVAWLPRRSNQYARGGLRSARLRRDSGRQNLTDFTIRSRRMARPGWDE